MGVVNIANVAVEFFEYFQGILDSFKINDISLFQAEILGKHLAGKDPAVLQLKFTEPILIPCIDGYINEKLLTGFSQHGYPASRSFKYADNRFSHLDLNIAARLIKGFKAVFDIIVELGLDTYLFL